MSTFSSNSYDPSKIDEFYLCQSHDEIVYALQEKSKMIVIKPCDLGDIAVIMIKLGDCLRRTAVISGVGGIITGLILPKNPFIFIPCGLVSGITTGLYIHYRQINELCNYKVCKPSPDLEKLYPMATCIVRYDDVMQKICHCSITMASNIFCLYRLIKLFDK